MNFLHIDNQIVVAFKPHNMTTNELKQEVKAKLESDNLKSSYLEQIYPICKEASGIVVFAVSSKAKKRLDEQIENQDFLLKYFAVCVGSPKMQDNMIYDEKLGEIVKNPEGQFVKRNQKTGKLEFIPSLTTGAVNIFDTYRNLETVGKISLVQIEGGFGFEDETRFILADGEAPVFGDKLYGGDILAKNTNLALCVVETKFVHPTTNKKLSFRVFPETGKKPWSYFGVEKLLKI